MKKYLLPQNGKFYKANLHTHTTISDGSLSPEEIKSEYMKRGYSIIAYTDHDVFIPHNDLTDENFLALNGYEMEILQPFKSGHPQQTSKTCHMCFVALDKDKTKQACWHRTGYLFANAVNYRDKVDFDPSLPDYEREYSSKGISDMMRIGRENGFFVTYNHPTWSGETYEDYMNYDNMHAMEIYNTECQLIGAEDYNARVYDDMLRGGKKLFCVATDDVHAKVSIGGGYIMIKADKLEYNTITDALLNGDFYSSTGPEIKELYIEDGILHVKTSPAKIIALSTKHRRFDKVRGDYGNLVSEGAFKVFDYDGYIRITVIDEQGNRANTNAYFLEDLLK